MAYLSRIWLNPLRTGAQKLIRNPQAAHAAVLGGLAEPAADERTLWRLESDNPHRAQLLVLTQARPSWEHLVEQAGWPGSDIPQAEVRDYQPLLDRLTIGQEYAFRLRANPVSATRNPTAPSSTQKEQLARRERPRGVIVPHRTVEHQMAWLTERIGNWGLALQTASTSDLQLQLVDRRRLEFTKTGRDGARRHVVLQTATFNGRVRVTDPQAAQSALLNGVGRARAYGCGMLTLAPAHPSPESTES